MTPGNTQMILQALALPASARVDQRVPKKLLLENGAPTASDKRLISDAVEDIQWLAALKPNTIGVPEYRDMQREYLEIVVLAVTLRGAIKPTSLSRLAELVHRAVPYPVLLLLDEKQDDGATLTLSLAHKRRAQNDEGKVVLDGDPQVAQMNADEDRELPAVDLRKPAASADSSESAFLASLDLASQPQASMYSLYQGWMDSVQALHAARRTGRFQTSATLEQVAARRQALADCQRLEGEISRLRAQAAKEKQLARQVELNLELKQLQSRLDQAGRHL